MRHDIPNQGDSAKKRKEEEEERLLPESISQGDSAKKRKDEEEERLLPESISSGAQYVTLRKYFSHPSLVMYSFMQPHQ